MCGCNRDGGFFNNRNCCCDDERDFSVLLVENRRGFRDGFRNNDCCFGGFNNNFRNNNCGCGSNGFRNGFGFFNNNFRNNDCCDCDCDCHRRRCFTGNLRLQRNAFGNRARGCLTINNGNFLGGRQNFFVNVASENNCCCDCDCDCDC